MFIYDTMYTNLKCIYNKTYLETFAYELRKYKQIK